MFSCGGIGDYGFKQAGITPVVLTDINSRRLSFAKKLHPNATLVTGDIKSVKHELLSAIRYRTIGGDFMLSMTPPCQGMSQNGIKTILSAIRTGKRPELDDRNYLIEPALDIVAETKPSFVFFENVPAANKTYLIIDGHKVLFTEYLTSRLRSLGYIGGLKVINFADYGTPQNRRRLVGLFTRNKNLDYDLFPNPIEKDNTLKTVIGNLPPLDAQSNQSAVSDFHPLHKVPALRRELYSWVSSTPEGGSALENNLCRQCGYLNETQDLYCLTCQKILDKPHITRNGVSRIIKGYNSSYRRLRWDKPANTLTTRSAFASSAYNLHPTQNRVLSAYECACLQGLKPELIDWVEVSTGKIYPDFFIRDVLGEAIPANFTYCLGKHLLSLAVNNTQVKQSAFTELAVA